MLKRTTAKRSVLGKFRRDDRGSFTVEALIWLPIFVVVMCMTADTAMIYAKQSQVMRVVQDANRAYAVGKFADAASTQNYILGLVRPMSPGATAVSSLANGIITTTVTMPARELMATGMLPMLGSATVRVVLQQMKEV
ncbi:hypothetical protein HYN69_03645 [Gemmobacter aquarius]|uniref:TadE-like domain-containing protein n=1 Tax=Paragemmobacter aquarius TaxID=2169400 RepID=A0A2S0UIR8_9RHOB|nr:TadE/TadG family type IV pilus assembly protein [Gemmobacter aquarius]AWB47714.1 hypothetical protein HYN69_03645 [Gemmobacter aquarius]